MMYERERERNGSSPNTGSVISLAKEKGRQRQKWLPKEQRVCAHFLLYCYALQNASKKYFESISNHISHFPKLSEKDQMQVFQSCISIVELAALRNQPLFHHSQEFMCKYELMILINVYFIFAHSALNCYSSRRIQRLSHNWFGWLSNLRDSLFHIFFLYFCIPPSKV